MTTTPNVDTARHRWRFRVGATLFVVGFAAPAAIPLVALSGLATGWKTALSGALAVGVPEIMMVAAVAVMGKQGFAEVKRRFGSWLRRYGPPDKVSRARYRLGLVMFTAPLLLGWLHPYIHRHVPGFDVNPMWWHVGGDLVFFASFFVLGGDFWDKLRSLFIHGARAALPPAGAKSAREKP